MEPKIDEIGDRMFRISVYVSGIAPPAGFTFNHFLILGEEPLLFHCGLKQMFPLVSAAAARIVPIERLRWLAFGHFEADECGAMNEWLAAAPRAEAMHGRVSCMVSLTDTASRPPRVLANGEAVDLGGKKVRYIDTPHVPHGWDAGVIFEETTRTLFCGDLFTRVGSGPALTESDIVEASIATEDMFHYTSLAPSTAATIRKLADLKPERLATMHGPSFAGDGAAALKGLADHYAARLRTALDEAGAVD